MSTNELIGKRFQLLNIDNSVIEDFVIKYAKNETSESVTHNDGSVSPAHEYTLVSKNSSAWYRIHGGESDRII